MRNKLGVCVIPKFEMDSASGGAENICRMVTLGLAERFNIVVFYSEPNRKAKLGIIKHHSEHIQSINAFYLDDWSRERGEISPVFCEHAKSILDECQIMLCFERVVTNVNIAQICILGGISYRHCVDVAKSKIWKKLLVPSKFLKQKCMELSNRGDAIEVIPNGIICNDFYPCTSGKKYAALLPYRPDIRKGFCESIDFVAMVNKLGEWGQIYIIVTKQDNNTFADERFYEYLDSYALEKGVKLEYVSWQTGSGMNGLYNKCDFVLALGDLEEGFGLVTIETIAAGSYVISKKRGATIDILPKNSGIIFADDQIDINSVRRIMIEYDKAFLCKLVERGMVYIKDNYDISIMQKKYDECVSTAIKKYNA